MHSWLIFEKQQIPDQINVLKSLFWLVWLIHCLSSRNVTRPLSQRTSDTSSLFCQMQRVGVLFIVALDTSDATPQRNVIKKKQVKHLCNARNELYCHLFGWMSMPIEAGLTLKIQHRFDVRCDDDAMGKLFRNAFGPLLWSGGTGIFGYVQRFICVFFVFVFHGLEISVPYEIYGLKPGYTV